MSSAYVLVAFAVCILLMILFISKWKIHPVTSILVATIILAISIGTPWDKIEGIINKGMADTLKSIAIVIVLGCILGKVLEETGAAVSITKATVKLFGEKRVLWAILLASAILGIPIWADTVVILLIPIVSNLALQTNKSMMSYGTALYMGALVTASLVPPTPGPVAAAALLHLPLSDAIMWGVLISIPSVFAAGLYCLTLKEPVAPQDEYIKSAEASKDKPLPSVGTSLAPIILPLVLIFLNTGINAMFPDTTVAKVFKFVGSPLAALLAGCLFSLVLTGAEWRSKKVMNDWVESALRSSASPLPPLTPYQLMKLGHLAVTPYAKPGSAELCAGVARLAPGRTALLMANHGSITGGASLTKALDAAEELEATCRLYLTLRGLPVRGLTPEQAAELLPPKGA